MISKEIEVIDLTNEQYEGLIRIQAKAYKQVLNFCKQNINDAEKLKIIKDTIIASILKTISDLKVEIMGLKGGNA